MSFTYTCMYVTLMPTLTYLFLTCYHTHCQLLHCKHVGGPTCIVYEKYA